MDSSFSLYIHIPFCNSFCDYCDFYSVSADKLKSDYIDSYLYALVKDIKNQVKYFSVENIPAAYIGGGSPSVLGSKIGFLLDELNKLQCFKPVEFTIEANSESITNDFLNLCREKGINRLSLGVQTLHTPSRITVNRKGDEKIIKENIETALKYFPDALSFDLITGLPHHNKEIIARDIKSLLEYKPSHVSLYSLTIEDNTALKEKINAKTVAIPDEEYADSLWLFGRNELINAGFNHYEISNFSREGKECLHNMRYWRMKNWLGAGASASGTAIFDNEKRAIRFTYSNDVDAYIKNPFINAALCENLDKNTLLRESLLMGFRCKEGPDPKVFKNRFGKTIEEYIPNSLLKYADRDKMLFLNSFLYDVFNELDSYKS
ncbi:MAG: radical SAM family heme chaperone HemW [Treponema sp.]|nr:radical SAM family heme chaperone HemW [Treponema sp.]